MSDTADPNRNKNQTSGLPEASSESGDVRGRNKLRWKYHRISHLRASKWVLGNNWVTKYDGVIGCVVGFNGAQLIDGSFHPSPSKARKWVENKLRGMCP